MRRAELQERFLELCKRDDFFYGESVLAQAKDDQLMHHLVWLYVTKAEDPTISSWCAMMMGYRMGERRGRPS